jgi:hypothetical protein
MFSCQAQSTSTGYVKDLVSTLLWNQQLNPSILPPAQHKANYFEWRSNFIKASKKKSCIKFQDLGTSSQDDNLAKQLRVLWRSDKSLINMQLIVIHSVQREILEFEHPVNVLQDEICMPKRNYLFQNSLACIALYDNGCCQT